jgi:hypothetical protein
VSVTGDRPLSRRLGYLQVALGGGLLVASFLPWLRSGARNRSGYELVAVAGRLGFAEGGMQEWAARLWPVVPLLVTTGAVAVLAGRQRAAAALHTLAGAHAVAVAASVRAAPVAAEPAVTATLAAGTLLAAVAVATLVVSRRVAPRVGPQAVP